MKKYLKYMAAAAIAGTISTSCLREAFPTQGMITEQVAGDESSVEYLVNSIPAAMFRFGSAYTSCGYPGMMILFDSMLQDMPVYDVTYDYYGFYVGTSTTYLGDYDLGADNWLFYSKLLFRCNSVIRMCDPDNLTPKLGGYLGNALAYRAFAYLDMVRMFEYRRCGVSALDSEAQTNGIYGLTVPIIDENLKTQDSYDNPRAEFWKAYRFIYTDLNLAEKCLETYKPASKIFADKSVIYGLQARLWIEIATRFRDFPEDMATALSHEDDAGVEYDKLGVSSAKQAYEKAAQYANLAQSGHSPLSQSEWMDPSTGFNTPKSSWMWCMSIGPDDDAVHSWKSWIPEINPEVQYGVVYPLNAFRMIDAALFTSIPDSDWRKTTWIAPGDAKKTSAYSKYQTNLGEDSWTKVPAYTGFKFRPAQGNIDDYNIGTAVSIPMMRVEEMMLIEAEALANAQGASAGKSALENFMAYRDPSYSCSASSLDGVTDEIFRQKRIEFWGEGIMMFDYKRLQKQITRGYNGSNFPDSHQINSLNGKGEVCRWLNFFITSSEYNYNKAVYEHRNPDPSGNAAYEY